MVLEVLADPRQVDRHRYPEPAELIGRPDPGQHQKLRRGERAGGKDHLAIGPGHALPAPPVAVANAPGAPVLELEPERLHAGDELQVRAAERRPQVGVGRAPAPAAPLGHLDERGAVLLVAVVVLDARDPRLLAGGEEATGQLPRRALVLDPQRAADRVMLGGPALVVLGLEEVGPDALPAPARRALALPEVVVERAARARRASRSSSSSRRAPCRAACRGSGRRQCGSGSVSKSQSSLVWNWFAKAAGILMLRLRSRPPASIRVTLVAGFSLSRAARVQPAEPAPTIK